MEFRRVLFRSEVPRRAAETRIVNVREEIVDGVTEFVKQGLGIVEADQHRLARRWLHEVVVVRAEHDLVAEQAGMAAEGRRPGARTLTRAGEVVAIEDADLLAGLAIGDAVEADVRMRAEEHTSEHQTIMRNSYSVF